MNSKLELLLILKKNQINETMILGTHFPTDVRCSSMDGSSNKKAFEQEMSSNSGKTVFKFVCNRSVSFLRESSKLSVSSYFDMQFLIFSLSRSGVGISLKYKAKILVLIKRRGLAR